MSRGCGILAGRSAVAALVLALFAGCGSLLPKPPPQPAFYALNPIVLDSPVAPTAQRSGPTLLVQPPQAVAGYDSPRIVYLRQPHRLEHFAHSEWVDTPARMLSPLVVAAVERSGAFAAVLARPSLAAGDLRLDTEVLRLHQDFASVPSRVRFGLRATLVDSATRRVLAVREFEQTVAAETDDPYGGVVAANRAVQAVLQSLSTFCAEAAGRWTAPISRR